MDKLKNLVHRLREVGIELAEKNGKVLLKGRKDLLNEEIVHQVATHKTEVLRYLNEMRATVDFGEHTDPSIGFILTEAQKKIWTADLLDESFGAFHIVLALDIEGRLNRDCFRTSIGELMTRHEALRSVFVEMDDDVIQFFLNPESFEIPVNFISKQEAGDSFCRDQLLKEEKKRPFDSRKGPLFRVTVHEAAVDSFFVVMTIHHIICDGISLGILKNDLFSFYCAKAIKSDQPTLQHHLQFKDFIVPRATAQQKEAAQRFWEDMYTDASLTDIWEPELSSQPSLKGDYLTCVIDLPLLEKFKALCSANRCTLFSGLYTVVTVWSYYKTGLADRIIGMVASGRTDPDSENVVGLFANALPVRNRFNPMQSFAALQMATANLINGVLMYQGCPMGLLLHKLRSIDQSLSRQPFDTLVALHNHVPANENLKLGEDLFIRDVSPPQYNGTVAYMFNFVEHTAGLTLTLEYNCQVVNQQQAEQALQKLVNIFKVVSDRPNIPIAELHCYDATEHETYMHLVCGPSEPLPVNQTLIHILIDHAEHFPNRIAIQYKGEAISYRVLANKVGDMASQLGAVYHLQQEDMIVVCSERNVQLLTVLLGILASGAAFVPISPDWPGDRVQFILKDTHCKYVITQKKFSSLFNNSRINVLYIEDLFYTSSASNGLRVNQSKPDALAYVIYTSGTTGTPKGAMLEHIGMLNHLLAKVEDLQMNPNSKVAQTAPLAFDISIWQMFAVLVCCGTAVIYDDETVKSPKDLLLSIQRDKITIVELVPSYLALILQLHDKPFALQGLTYLVVTGEALSFSLLKQWFTYFPSTPLVNAYGPTEASDDVTHHIFYEVPKKNTVPLGRPIRNFRIYVVNQWGNLMPVGTKGELLVCGPGVGRGYLNHPDKTAQAFFKDQYFPHVKYNRLYATGDLGRWTDEGVLEFMGRKDNQVKLRGYRIELEEIERTASNLNRINCAAACLIENKGSGDRLVLFIEGEEDSLRRRDLEAHLVRKLPRYMLPTQIIFVKKFPTTANGKIDKKSLVTSADTVDVETCGFGKKVEYSDFETKIIALWEEVLQKKLAAAEEMDFFHLGGDSFKAILLASHLSKLFQMHITLKDIFACPNLQAQCMLVGLIGAEKYTDMGRLDRVEGDYPLSPVQADMYNNLRLMTGKSPYNLIYCFTIKGSVNVEKLNLCLNHLIKRHSVLRTTFLHEDDEGWQRVHPIQHQRIRLQPVDEYLWNPLDITEGTTGSLFKVCLLTEKNQPKLLLVHTHHLVCDGFSVEMLMSELKSLYGGSDLQGQPLQYIEYANWINRKYQPFMDQQVAFWRSEYEGRKLDMPTLALKRGADLDDISAARFSTHIKGCDYDSVVCISKHVHATPANVLLSAFLILLYKYTQCTKPTIGVPVNGRSFEESFRCVGPFANIIPFTAEVNNGRRVNALIKDVQERMVLSLENQLVPFGQIKRQVKQRFSNDPNTLFSTAFSCEYKNVSVTAFDEIRLDDQLTLAYMPSEHKEDLKYHLHLRCHLLDDRIVMELEYRKTWFAGGFITALLEDLTSVLRQLSSGIEKTIGDIELLELTSSPHNSSIESLPFNF